MVSRIKVRGAAALSDDHLTRAKGALSEDTVRKVVKELVERRQGGRYLRGLLEDIDPRCCQVCHVLAAAKESGKLSKVLA